MRNLTLKGKIIVFKTLALSKIIHICFTSVLPKQIIEEIENIQKNFLQNRSTPKNKHGTLCNSFATGGLTNLDIIQKLQVFDALGKNDYMRIVFMSGN